MSPSQVPTPYAQQRPAYYPKYTRPRQGRVVGGVAVGLAEHLGVRVALTRFALIIAALFSGAGILFYALLWIASKPGPEQAEPRAEKTRISKPVYLLLVLLTLVGATLSVSLVTGFGGSTLIPLAVAAVGALVAWQAYDRGLGSGRSLVTIVFGAVLVLAGIIVVVFNWEGSTGFGPALVAVLLTLAGVAALAVPLGLRLWDSLSQERAEKAAADERADIASHLHDSVLQTLALIQKRADDPAEVTRLARGQERELRQWLFDPQEKHFSTIFAAVEHAAGEVEDLFGIRIAPVTVGTDRELGEDTQAAVLAAREAMVNAAKHAEVDSADVYAELLGGELAIFIRDRGVGFDPEAVPEDRHGIRDSIHARVKRIGGTVKLRSAPGEGTEVAITIPLD